jgi:hypothetical protein
MEEATENSKGSSHSAHAIGMNEWMSEWMVLNICDSVQTDFISLTF